MISQKTIKQYLYTYSYHEDEEALCMMEMRSLFGFDTYNKSLISTRSIDPSRSPFIKECIEIIFEAQTFNELLEQVKNYDAGNVTFKVKFLNVIGNEKVAFNERKQLEREIGLELKGNVDLKTPQKLFALVKLGESWIFGSLTETSSVWLTHQKKPHNYSTALTTRVARALVNIAVPITEEVTVIDPCCGIGTVLIEALSMGISIVGSDNNPLVLPRTRENLAFFQLQTAVLLCDINEVKETYDIAIIDIPYNLCSVLPYEEKLQMLKSARRFSKKLVIVTIEPIDDVIIEAGFLIVDRCLAKKSSFSREIISCI